MDSKELRGLMEAYSEVYAPQENIEEGLRSAVKRLLSGSKKEAEAPKPESRGEQLRKKYNVGPEKSDTSAKRQILNRSRARAERDEKDYGDSKYSKSVAQKSKAAHERYLKAGYSKYGADDARGSGNKARKRAAALNREEFDWLVNSLLDEGYDLSTYTVEEFYDFCCEEVEQLDELSDRKLRAYIKKSEKSHKAINKKWDQGTATEKEKLKSIGHEIGQERAFKRLNKEDFDIFDVVLEFLQVEGYAETLEEAEWMMANIIDEEAIGIILGEEQLDEISQKTATRAYAASSTGEFEGQDSPRDVKRTDNLRRQIKRKFGDKAAQHADRAAHAMTFGRNSKFVKMPPKPTKEDFELWVNELVEEGYDLSDYTWDEMYDIYEAEKPFPYEKVKSKQVALRDKGSAGLDRRMKMGMAVRRAKEAEKTGGSQRDAGKGWYHAKEAFEAWLDEAMTNYEKNRKRAAQRAAARNAARDAGKTGAVPGVGYVTPRRESEYWTDESGKKRHAKGL